MNCLPVSCNDRMPGKGSKGGQDVQRKDLHQIGLLAFAAVLVAGGAKAQDNYPSQTVKVVLRSAVSRARMSVVEPGAEGSTTFTVCEG